MHHQIGQYYEVPCAELRWKEDNRVYLVPVLDHLHSDPQFGFPHEHYHIDGRFEIHPRMRHQLKITDGHTRSVIVTHDQGLYYFERLVQEKLRLERLTTGLIFTGQPNPQQAQNLQAYRDWYQTYVGKKCSGRRCPHYGTAMLEQDGKLVCPMHHLTADPVTQYILPLSNL